MRHQLARPEDRRRAQDAGVWIDTLPACFRSEAFAEDLTEGGSTASQTAAAAPAAPTIWHETASSFGLLARLGLRSR